MVDYMSNSFILPIDKNLLNATTSGRGGPGNNGNEGVLQISKSITGSSPFDGLMTYTRHTLVGFYASVDVQSVYSIAPVNRYCRGCFEMCRIYKTKF